MYNEMMLLKMMFDKKWCFYFSQHTCKALISEFRQYLCTSITSNKYYLFELLEVYIYNIRYFLVFFSDGVLTNLFKLKKSVIIMYHIYGKDYIKLVFDVYQI